MNRTQRLVRHLQQIARAARPPVRLAVVVLVAAVLFALMIPAIPVGIWTDDGIYIAMARSLAQGKGLRLTYLPTEPVYPIVPIGYPLALAPLVALFPDSFLPLQLLSSGFLLITVVLVYRYARPRLGEGMALLAVALFATNLAIVHSAAQVMSEALFLLCVLGALLQTEKFARLQLVRWHHMLITAAVIGLPLSVRYLGSPIVAALMLYILWRRRDRWAVGAIALAVLFLLVINLGLGGPEVGQYYIDRFSGLISGFLSDQASGDSTAGSGVADGGLLARIANNVWFILTYSIPSILVPLFQGPRIRAFFEHLGFGFVPDAMQLGIVLLLAVGLIQQLRRQARASEWCVLFYSASMFLLPTDWETLPSRVRYWIPLIPFGYMYLLTACQFVDRLIIHRIQLPHSLAKPWGLVLLGATCMLIVNLGRDMQESMFNPLRDRLPDPAAGSEWIQTHSEPNDVIMVPIPQVTALYLHRKVVPYPDRREAMESSVLYSGFPQWQRAPLATETLYEILEEFNVAYILIRPAHVLDQPLQWTNYTQSILFPVLRSRPDRFRLVWVSEDGFTQVYRVQPTAASESGNLGNISW